MKKLIFGLIATIMFGQMMNAQSNRRGKLVGCIHVSCCIIDFIGAYICMYQREGGGNTGTLHFDSNVSQKDFDVPEDVLLNNTDEKGDYYVLPKGKYEIIGNEVSFIPVVIPQERLSIHCFTVVTTGQIFGHEFAIEGRYCMVFGLRPNRGLITIKLNFDENQLSDLSNSNNEIEFKKEINIKEITSQGKEINTTINPGKYKVNPDGTIYLQEVVLN